MKRIFTLFTVFAVLSSFILFSSIDEIVAALKVGNSSEIAKYFDNTVEITLPDKSNSYSKSQAEVILRDFFTNNPVKSFSILHKGENGGSEYCIGTLVTKNASYRTTVFMKQKANKQTLQEIRFETK
ncbi:hypothetical protein BH11BAC4_BH11BAC4_11500 [soil metagenome]